MIYLYLFGTCFHFIYVFMIIGNDYNKVFVYQDKAAKRSLMFDVEKTMNEIYSIL